MEPDKPEKKIIVKDRKRTHVILFLVTLLTSTLAGSEWIYGRSFIFGSWTMGWREFIGGFEFSIPFLAILTAHEFGHYFTAGHHKVKVSLPFYLPFWTGFIGLPSIGTFGAFIRIRERIYTKIQNFDIGIAGPLAGFVLSLVVLLYGFTHLPPKEHIYSIHPEYQVFGTDFDKYIYTQDTFILKTDVEKYNPEYAQHLPDTIRFPPDNPNIAIGSTLLFSFFKHTIVPDSHKDRIPNAFEIMHYPWLLAGFLALFFTALNLLPIGQLDGGHVIYGLFGSKNHAIISRVFFISLVYYAGLGLISPFKTPGGSDVTGYLIYIPLYIFLLYYMFAKLVGDKMNRLLWAVGVFAAQFFTLQFFPEAEGYNGWLLFAFIIGRFIGIDYPAARIEEPLDVKRKVLGWIALVVFILCFSPAPLIITGV